MPTTQELIETVNSQYSTIKAALTRAAESDVETQNRVGALEQAFANFKPGSGGGSRGPTWGSQVAASDRLKSWMADGGRGSARIPIKAEISTPSGTEQRDLVAPDRQPIQGLPQQKLTIRDLLSVSPTTSNLISYVRQTARDNLAAPVADGVLKPTSDFTFELAEAPVRTIAHILPVPRQTFEDVAGLSAIIDSEMRFGVQQAEEIELLSGDGTGEHLLGLVSQATPYDAPFAIADENGLDRILLAIVQAQQSRLPCDAVIVNDITWAQLISLKDSEGRYLAGAGGGPFGTIPGLLWQVKVIPTPSLDQGEVLLGSFRLGARLHDRMAVEILISSEDSDNFRKNMLTIRAEERVALAVRVPDAFVFIDDLGVGFTG